MTVPDQELIAEVLLASEGGATCVFKDSGQRGPNCKTQPSNHLHTPWHRPPGFSSPRDHARKLVALFAIAKEGCSAQQHYDWGLRALKAALGAAGRLLREVRAALL
jgi:hypothetical protein